LPVFLRAKNAPAAEKCAFRVNHPAMTVVAKERAGRRKEGKLVKIRIFFQKSKLLPL
jgi:hypothetical protein